MTFSIKRSLIIPVYRNEHNIPDLLSALEELTASLNGRTELVFVVDGSPDDSGKLLRERLSDIAFPAQLLFHSRNFGSFAAIRTGLIYSRGTSIAVMAADLQEPPDLMKSFFYLIEQNEADVVFGHRLARHDGLIDCLMSKLYWGLYRRFIMPDVPPGGIDVFACNQKVRAALLSIEESNSSLIAQLFWIGFRRRFVGYTRRAREKGKSAWSIKRRFEYALDSIFSYSDLPIMSLLWIGSIGVFLSITLSFLILVARLLGFIEVPGYTALMLTILFVGSLILFSQGLVGCYLWRTLENTKRRPLTLVSESFEYHGCREDREDG